MERGKLSYGLNVSKKSNAPKKAKMGNAFGGSNSDDDDSNDDGSSLFTAKAKWSSSGTKPASRSVEPIKPIKPKGVHGGIASTSVVAAVSQDKAEELDPSIYDYDAAWDNMHALERKKADARNADAAERKPRYMGNLLAAAEVRKRDQLRAKDRLIQKEREAEGEEFGDKEKFVTEAYKKQQAELREAEKEEQLREERLASKSQGLTSFYRTMLDRTEQQHTELVTLAENEVSTERADGRGFEDDHEPTDAEVARKINAQSTGAVAVNDEGQVVDKRELLSAGLNVQPKKKTASAPPRSVTSTDHSRHPENVAYNRDRWKRQERQQAMVEKQWETSQKRTAESADISKKAIENEAKIRKTTNADVRSARERYLERKRLAAGRPADN